MALLLVAGLAACAGGRGGAAGPNTGTGVGSRRSTASVSLEAADVYQRVGLLASSTGVPFVGQAAMFAGRTPDSATALVALSFANRAFTFAREGERYRAAYETTVELRRDGVVVKRVTSRDTVRVATFRETTRSEETVLFQQPLVVPPGSYTLSVAVRDLAGQRSGAASAAVVVPRFGPGSLSRPVAVYEGRGRTSRDSLPPMLLNPRSTATYGRDSVVLYYLEAYPTVERASVAVTVRGEGGRVLTRDSVLAARSPDGVAGVVLRLPVSRLGVGILRVDARVGSDSTSAPLLVGVGEGLLVVNFDELVSYLRYFADAEVLRPLRDSVPEARAAAWASLQTSTDPVPTTPEHEGLRTYFSRIETANLRFREDGVPGWLTDRGMVLATLGEPENIIEPQETSAGRQLNRGMVWEYRQLRLGLLFQDQTGFGRWRLTPESEAAFYAAVRRMRAQ